MERVFLNFRIQVLQNVETPDQERFASLLALQQRVIDSIYLLTMSGAKQSGMTRQLHQLQRQCILLSNELHVNHSAAGTQEYCSFAQQGILEILKSIKQCDERYFDVNQSVPHVVVAEVIAELKKKMPQLQAGLKRGKISAQLQTIVCYPFLHFSTYLQMHYVLTHIDPLISYLNEPRSEDDLLHHLLCSGLNTQAFTTYYRLILIEKVKTNPSITAQLEMLYEYEAELRCLPKEPMAGYDYQHESSRTVALKLIRAEMNCLHNKQDLTTSKTSVARPAGAATSADYRIKTSLSVDGVAYLLKLFIETEVIEASPRSQLFAFMAASVQTRGKGEGNISADSLATKYRQVNQSTAAGVKTLLIRMAKQVKDNFNI